MKTWKQRKFNPVSLFLLSLLLLGAALVYKPQATVMAQVLPSSNSFFVRNYGGKCLDFGAPPQAGGAPVFIYDCNGTAAQRIVPVEIDSRPTSQHAVLLLAGNNKVIGVKGNALIQQAPLELQDYNGSAGQIFELDGDSIILAADRKLVVEVQHARGANRTPLILGNRDLADAEFWTFSAIQSSASGLSSHALVNDPASLTSNSIYGPNPRPTRGFVRISQTDNSDDGELRARAAFLNAIFSARWGTVIELDPNVSLNLADTPPLYIPAGVTIRGDRRGTRPGPLLAARNQHPQEQPKEPFPNSDVGMFFINGNHVRITGLRMQGPGRNEGAPYANGISMPDKFSAIIDHNELFDWPAAAIYVKNEHPDQPNPYSRPQNLRVARNFIHHNLSFYGYGVHIDDSYPSIEGNTFLSHYHAIAASKAAHSAYTAWFNLVLSASPRGGSDFDAHGTGEDDMGGRAGQYFEIARNTFLGANDDRENFKLRGTPIYLAEFHHNVSLLSREDALTNQGDSDKLVVSDNQFSASNPTSRLGVGDFDGDGTQDLFLATGAAWYYAPAGKAEWRYLNAQTDKLGTLLFGDFDADGRTDVFTQHAYNWDVSWGGASRWEHINVSWAILGNAAVGDFIGDERDDIFYTDGQTWYASDGGAGQFVALDASSYRVPNLRFGDFNADGKTDVFSVVSGNWAVAYSGTSGWQPLRSKLTDSVAGLIVADFNGDRRADVATSVRLFTSFVWRVSYSGTDDWTTLRTAGVSLASAAAIGRFDVRNGADVLLWHNNYLDIAPRGAGNSNRYSRPDVEMR